MRLAFRLALVCLLVACNGASRTSPPECGVAADCVLYDSPDCCDDPCDGPTPPRAVTREVFAREQAVKVEACRGKQLDCPRPECDRNALPAVDCQAGTCVVVIPAR